MLKSQEQLDAAAHERVYDLAWQLSADALVLTDSAGIILDVNPAFCTLFGLTREQALGSSFAALFPAESREQMIDGYGKLFASREAPHSRETSVSYRGRRLVIDSRFAFLPSDSAPVALLTSVRDVTEQRQREETLLQQTRYEHALTECSRTLLNSAPDEDARQRWFGEALEHLRQAAQADRAYLFENFDDPQAGFCSGIRAEAHAPDVPANLGNPRSRKIPWSDVPERNRLALAAGEAAGGPVEESFAGHPEMIARLHGQGIRSVLFLPIHFEGRWWGYVGLDDCTGPRVWSELDVRLLQTAAEMFGMSIQRHQVTDALQQQHRYQRALAYCSQSLLNNPQDAAQERRLLEQALQALMQAVEASRAHIFRSFDDPEVGECFGMVAETCAPGVQAQIGTSVNRRFPWSQAPEIMRNTLADGRPFGGPITRSFASHPQWIEIFLQQMNPLLSIQLFPIHIAGEWWGFIGFDDVVSAREWSDAEITVLRTASEIVASALERWQGWQLLEQRVQARTAEVVESNERLLAEIGQRRRAEADLARRLQAEQTLTQISARLLRHAEPLETFRQTLEGLGELVRARRMVLIVVQEGASPFETDNFQWYAAGEAPLPPDIAIQFRTHCPWLWQSLRDATAIYLSQPDELPADASEDKAFLLAHNVARLALIPLITDGRITAVLASSDLEVGFDDQPENLRILQLGANLIASMLQREAIVATLEQRVADRTQELSTLFDITLLTGEAASLKEMLEPAVQRLAEIGYWQAVCVHLLGEEAEKLTLVAQRGLDDAALSQVREIAMTPGVAEFLVQTRRQAVMGRLTDLQGIVPAAYDLLQFQVCSISQLVARGRTLGLLTAYRTGNDNFSLSQTSLLQALADQLGIAVENHHLQRQTTEMAAMAERQRLARELHDSITQSMYSQTLFARTGRYALEDGDLAKAEASLRKLEEDTRISLGEMRLLLFQLQPFSLGDLSLEEAIEQRFDAVERRLAIAASFEADGAYTFSDDVLPELYRIIMEALNNALKHASARHVSIEVRRAGDVLGVRVVDDGAGFCPEDVRGGMGLETMRQRAAQIGGLFSIESGPGAGTRVALELPLAYAVVLE